MTDPIPDDLVQKMREAQAVGLQTDLRNLAERIRQANPDRSAEFSDGVDWVLLYIENTANGLTEGRT